VVHEQFQTSPNIYDIAVVKVATPIEYYLGVSPICLPLGNNFKTEDFYGRTKSFDLVAWPKYK
jgi:hypothetical protein